LADCEDAVQEENFKEDERAAAAASEKLEAAKDRRARLQRGEGVVGGLGKKSTSSPR
jgi:hypothetical protein